MRRRETETALATQQALDEYKNSPEGHLAETLTHYIQAWVDTGADLNTGELAPSVEHVLGAAMYAGTVRATEAAYEEFEPETRLARIAERLSPQDLQAAARLALDKTLQDQPMRALELMGDQAEEYIHGLEADEDLRDGLLSYADKRRRSGDAVGLAFEALEEKGYVPIHNLPKGTRISIGFTDAVSSKEYRCIEGVIDSERRKKDTYRPLRVLSDTVVKGGVRKANANIEYDQLEPHARILLGIDHEEIDNDSTFYLRTYPDAAIWYRSTDGLTRPLGNTSSLLVNDIVVFRPQNLSAPLMTLEKHRT